MSPIIFYLTGVGGWVCVGVCGWVCSDLGPPKWKIDMNNKTDKLDDPLAGVLKTN